MRSRKSPCSSMRSSSTVPPVPHARLRSCARSFRNAALRGRSQTTLTVLPPRPAFSIRNFATTRTGTGALASRVLHVQFSAGHPQPGHMRPDPVE